MSRYYYYYFYYYYNYLFSPQIAKANDDEPDVFDSDRIESPGFYLVCREDKNNCPAKVRRCEQYASASSVKQTVSW